MARNAKMGDLAGRAETIWPLVRGGVSFSSADGSTLLYHAQNFDPRPKESLITGYRSIEGRMRAMKRPRYQDPATGEIRYWRQAFDREPPGTDDVPAPIALKPPVEMLYPTVANTVKATTVEQFDALYRIGWRPRGACLTLEEAMLAPFRRATREPCGEPSEVIHPDPT